MADTKLTLKTLIASIHALGLTCGRYDPAVGELRIDYRRDDPRWTPHSTYFVEVRFQDGRRDALATATVMAAALRVETDGDRNAAALRMRERGLK